MGRGCGTRRLGCPKGIPFGIQTPSVPWFTAPMARPSSRSAKALNNLCGSGAPRPVCSSENPWCVRAPIAGTRRSSPDRKTIVSASALGSVRRWDVASTQLIGRAIRLGDPVAAMQSEMGGMIRKNQMPAGTNHGNNAQVQIAWHERHQKALTARRARRMPPQANHIMPRIGVNSSSSSSDGKILLTGSSDKTARLWDVATGQPVGKPMEHQESVTFVAFSPDGKTILTGSGGRARYWNVATARPIGQPIESQYGVYPIAFSPDSRSILARDGFGRPTLRTWDIATGQPIGRPMGHQISLISVALSPDGSTILTGSSDKTARLWDVATGQPVGPSIPHPGPVAKVAYSSDGRTIATAR